jgi:hypothetical protein
MKENLKDTSQWKNIVCLQILRINIFELSILLWVVNINIIFIKIPMFYRNRKNSSEIHMEPLRPHVGKQSWARRINLGAAHFLTLNCIIKVSQSKQHGPAIKTDIRKTAIKFTHLKTELPRIHNGEKIVSSRSGAAMEFYSAMKNEIL